MYLFVFSLICVEFYAARKIIDVDIIFSFVIYKLFKVLIKHNNITEDVYIMNEMTI